MSKHTPGQWTTVDESSAGPRGDVSYNHQLLAGDLWLASISSGDYETREQVAMEGPRIEANLRLIAAAPDLLKALVEAVADMKEKGGWISGDRQLQMEAAIANAETK